MAADQHKKVENGKKKNIGIRKGQSGKVTLIAQDNDKVRNTHLVIHNK